MSKRKKIIISLAIFIFSSIFLIFCGFVYYNNFIKGGTTMPVKDIDVNSSIE